MAATVCEAAPDTRTPVTIITGFLGAGKTTLLNYILREKGQRNIAVIENEFGEVNIDNELVAENLVEKEDLVSLDNGCVCCSLRKDIIKALAEIERRSRSRNRRLDAVILETTGLADPAPVAFTFFANPWIASRFRLDAILCVVDCRYVMQHLVTDEPTTSGNVNETAQQLAFADLILLNKVDLVTAHGLEAVRQAVRTINQSAKLVECKPGQRPPLADLLDSNSFSVNKALAVDPFFLASDSGSDCSSDDRSVDDEGGDECETGTSGRVQGSDDGHHHHHHKRSGSGSMDASNSEHSCADRVDVRAEASTDTAPRKQRHERQPKRRRKQLHDLSGVGSVGIVARGPLDEYRFNMFMRDLLAEKAKDIYRCKGVLAVHGYGNKRFVFQGVHETICYGPSERPWAEGEPMINQMVFIGRNLDRKALIEGFRTCVWQDLPEGWREAQDPVSLQLYYYNTHTRQKQWARPQAAHVTSPPASMAVTATRLTSMEQPLSLQPSRRRTSVEQAPSRQLAQQPPRRSADMAMPAAVDETQAAQ